MNAFFDDQVAASYESWYETVQGERAAALEKAALEELLEGFPGAGTILEVGCGTGHFTRWLHDAGWMAMGLDLSPAMLKEAQALDDAPLVQGDAFRLPFADGAFDVTSLITTLEFLERPEAALGEALRVGRQGVLLGVLNRWSLLALQRRLTGLFRPTIYDDARFYGLGALTTLLRAAADDATRVEWLTTLLPGWARRVRPRPPARRPWGGFIAMALHKAR